MTEDFLKKVTIRCEIVVDLALMLSDTDFYAHPYWTNMDPKSKPQNFNPDLLGSWRSWDKKDANFVQAQ